MTKAYTGPAQGFEISKKISVQIDEVEVKGTVTGCSYDIDVVITQPFKNLTNGAHIPVLARGLRRFDSRYGDLRAKQLLEELYLLAKYIQHNRDYLKTKLDESRQKIQWVSRGRLTVDEFKQQREKLRARLRTSAISNMDYQQWVRHMGREAESLQFRCWEFEEEFWDGSFPTVIGMSMRDSIVKILDGRRQLEAQSNSYEESKNVY